MIILGVDPGTNFLGYAVIKVIKNKVHVLEVGDIKLNKLTDHSEKLRKIFVKLSSVIAAYDPNSMAIEAPFYGKNPQSMLKLGRAQGVSIAAAAVNQLDVTEYAPKKVKLAITGKGNATKEQVQHMLAHLIENKVDLESLDASDALGVAICHHLQLSSPLHGMSKGNSWEAFIKENEHRIVKN